MSGEWTFVLVFYVPLFALLAVVWAVGRWWDARIKRLSRRTEGRVIATWKRGDLRDMGSSPYTQIEYSYRVDGRLITRNKRVRGELERKAVGNRVTIYYRRDNPSRHKLEP